MVVEVLANSIKQARMQAQRVVSMSHMLSIGTGLFQYAEKHDGAFPESLEDLFRALPRQLSMSLLTSPYHGQGPTSLDEISGGVYLILRPGLSIHSDPDQIVLAERRAFDGRGANFLFADGHGEYLPEPQASEIIERIKAGAADVRK